jgi:hypothetical protein
VARSVSEFDKDEVVFGVSFDRLKQFDEATAASDARQSVCFAFHAEPEKRSLQNTHLHGKPDEYQRKRKMR